MNTSTRRQGLLVLGLMVLGAFLEAAGVGLVFPLVKVISEPDVILNSPITTFLFGTVTSENQKSILLILVSGFFVAIVVKNLFLLLIFFHRRSILSKK